MPSYEWPINLVEGSWVSPVRLAYMTLIKGSLYSIYISPIALFDLSLLLALNYVLLTFQNVSTSNESSPACENGGFIVKKMNAR